MPMSSCGAMRRSAERDTHHIGAMLAWWVVLLLGVSGYAQATVMAPEVYPYEQAFRDARVVVRGDIVAYDARRGATLRVSLTERGDAQPGTEYLLGGSAGYSFLAALPRGVLAFASARTGDTLQLWQGPTSGGLSTSEPGLLGQLSRALTDPKAALHSPEVRERLAGAFFMTRGGGRPVEGLMPLDRDAVVEAAAWGMRQADACTNQAAVDILEALGFGLRGLGIDYHPFYKTELKAAAAAKLRAWWAQRR